MYFLIVRQSAFVYFCKALCCEVNKETQVLKWCLKASTCVEKRVDVSTFGEAALYIASFLCNKQPLLLNQVSGVKKEFSVKRLFKRLKIKGTCIGGKVAGWLHEILSSLSQHCIGE